WEKLGMSRAAWYRRNKHRSSGETTLSAAILLSSEDRPVSPEGGAGLAERGFASKKARGRPSSQTATTMVADAHAAVPTELRLLAVGLVETDWTKNLARAAGCHRRKGPQVALQRPSALGEDDDYCRRRLPHQLRGLALD